MTLAKWVGTNYIMMLPADDFADCLCNALNNFRAHTYNAERLALYFKH